MLSSSLVKDPHIGVLAVVSLDGSEITTLSSAHQNSAELSNLPTGLHSLRVDLVPIGSANRPKVPTVLHSEIIFTVVRPTVTLHSAHALPEGVVVVKVRDPPLLRSPEWHLDAWPFTT